MVSSNLSYSPWASVLNRTRSRSNDNDRKMSKISIIRQFYRIKRQNKHLWSAINCRILSYISTESGDPESGCSLSLLWFSSSLNKHFSTRRNSSPTDSALLISWNYQIITLWQMLLEQREDLCIISVSLCKNEKKSELKML